MKKLFKKLYNKSADDFYRELNEDLKEGKRKFIVTANPETFMLGIRDKSFKKLLLDKKTTIVPDGIGIVKAAKKFGTSVTERIPGVDIAQVLMKYGNDFKKSIYLFGAKQEVLDMLKKKMSNDYPNLNIVGLQHGYEKDREKVFKDILSKKPDILLVALGIPEQERLIYNHIDKFNKGILVGVGGSFDVLSGYKKRAPKIFIKTNTEWLYRILKEPKRIKRFWNNNVKFLLNIKRYK